MFAAWFFLSASSTIARRSGAVLHLYSSRFVTKLVRTEAPFSYVIEAPTHKAQEEEEEELKIVSAGAKRKNFIPFSSYQRMI